MTKIRRVLTALKRSGSTDRMARASQGPLPTSNLAGTPATANDSIPGAAAYVVDDTPEANIRRAITMFCESGGTAGPQAGDEVLYLPPIVDAAECSPTAAKEASVIIRKYLDMKHASKPYAQYNAIMIMRILSDNPGKTFTRNLDAKFADKVKDLLKNGRDQSVRQLLAETLEYFEVSKKEDEGLSLLKEVWAKQKAIMAKYQPPAMMYQPVAPPPPPHTQASPSRTSGGSSLPPLEELVGRISEAQSSAKLLHQVLASTPRNEVLKNDLVKEFVHRCKSASRSMQDLITCDSPPPDQDTLHTLIETNDILRMALARYQAIKEAQEMQKHENQSALGGADGSNKNAKEPHHANLENPFSDIPPLSLDNLNLNENEPGPSRKTPPLPPPKIDTQAKGHSSTNSPEVSPITPGLPKGSTGAQITYRY